MPVALPDPFCEVDPATVASDSFMVNVHLILLRFAEPFMDAQYTKVSGTHKCQCTCSLIELLSRLIALIRFTTPAHQEST